MLIVTDRLIRKGYSGFACYPFIFLTSEYCACVRTLRHEKIHLAQQKELLVVGFYLLYFGEYLYRRMMCGSWKEAYRAISFEREAYSHDGEEGYLERRKRFAWRSEAQGS